LSNKFEYSLIIALAVSSHILITISLLGNPLRVCASDLLLPLLLGSMFVLSMRGEKFITHESKNTWIIILLITIWITYSLLNGYYNTGNLEKWSLFNKYAGWFVLITYFIVGIWIGKHDDKKQELFISTFMMVAWMVACYGLLGLYAEQYGISFEYIFLPKGNRIEGFFANANAFGIACAAIIILQLSCAVNHKYFNKAVHVFTLSLLILALIFSFSRSAWLGFILGLIFMIIMQKGVLKYFILASLVAFLVHISIIKTSSIIVSISNNVYSENHADQQIKGQQLHKRELKRKLKKKLSISKRLSLSRPVGVQGVGMMSRMDFIKYGFKYWKESPMTGIGIGSYKVFSMRDDVNKYGYQIHASILWVIIEMGLIGLCLFAVLFVNLFRHLLVNTNNRYITIGIAGILIVMLGSSIGTEVLYQRYLWILLGIGLSITTNRSVYD